MGKIYDIVILAIGFGLEAFLDGDTPSYWLPSQMSAALLTTQPDPLIFVSGNGDGGLVDFPDGRLQRHGTSGHLRAHPRARSRTYCS